MATLVFDIETSALTLDTFDDSSQEYLMRPAARLATEEEQEAKRVNKPVVELPVSGSDGESIAHAATHSHDSSAISQSVAHFMEDAPTCPTCGNVTVRNGACFKCLNCGESLGCS